MSEPEKLLGKVQFDHENGSYCCQILHLSKIEIIEAKTIDELRLLIGKTMAESSAESGAVDTYPNEFDFDNLLLLEAS